MPACRERAIEQRGRRTRGERAATDRTRVREPAPRQQRAARAVLGGVGDRGERVAEQPGRRLDVARAQQRRACAAGGGTRASSAWQRRHVSMWRSTSTSDRLAVDERRAAAR